MSKTSILQAYLRTVFISCICFVLGSVSSLAMAPANAWPILFLSLGALYYCIAKAETYKGAFFNGWLFGFGYFVFGLSWIGNALLVEGNPYAWAWPLAVSGLPFMLAFFPALACLLAKRFFDLRSLSGYTGFTAALFLSELLRGYIFTGFPWNLYGYSWADILPIVQSVAVIGIYGLTWLTIFWAAAPGFIALKNASNKSKIILTVLALMTYAGCFGFGQWHLEHTKIEYRKDIRFRLVQPNIPQHEKWDGHKMTENFFKLIRLSMPTSDEPEPPGIKATYIIWPETALSYWYTEDETSMNVLEDALSHAYRGQAYILTGLLRKEGETYSNSLVSIDKKGQISNVYNKHHLVPFGEYIPFQKWIPLKTVTSFSGFVPGGGPVTLETPEGLHYTPLICYEAIFPGLVPHDENKKPDFILNVTNDGWYGDSAGPYQHMSQARFRAVEEGVTLIRVANTGFTAIIDPLGRILQKSTLFTDYAITATIPIKIMGLAKKISINIFWLLCIALVALALGCKQKYITAN